MKSKNKMQSKWFLLFVSCVILFPLTSSAELLIEESFKTGTNSAAGEYALIPTGTPAYYPIGDQTNTVTGFTGAWYKSSLAGSAPRLNPGLVYTNAGLVMATSGNSIVCRASPARWGRGLAVPFDANTTGIYYLGFLYKQNALDKGYRSPFQLYSDDTMPTKNLVLALSMDASTVGQVNIDALGTTTSLGELGTAVNFVVFRFNMSSVDKSDSVALYLNPSLDKRLELQTPLFMTNSVNITFNTLAVGRSQVTGSGDNLNVYSDEIRMSKNYFEVSTVPPAGMTVIVVR